MNEISQDITKTEASTAIQDEIDIQPLLDKAHEFVIQDEKDAKNALSMSLQARKLKKTLDESRMRIIRPHFDFQKAVNTIVKDYKEKLDMIGKNLKEKLEDWLKLQKTFEPNFSSLMTVEDGSLQEKIEWTFQVIEPDKIPHAYLTLNDRTVKEAIKRGIRDIPGLKIEETKKITMRCSNG